MRILFIGDVIAKPGRRAVAALLPGLRNELALDLVIANGENSAGGAGITLGSATDLFAAGVDLLTTGNHVWQQREALTYLPTTDRVVRPANFPPGTPGLSSTLVDAGAAGGTNGTDGTGGPRGMSSAGGAGGADGTGDNSVLLTSVLGRVFMDPLDDPFRVLDAILAERREEARIVVVDVHAEATSEKRALGYHLDGRASLVVGTHTHVPTADAQILPGGTAYVTDVGMVGPRHSVIGVEVEPIIHRFITALPQHFDTSRDKTIQFNAVLAEIDAESGRARTIERVDRLVTLGQE